MDIGSAFTFMFDDEEWVKKLAIGGGLALLGVILSPIIIGLILFIPLMGYMIETIDAVRKTPAGQKITLPEWSDFGNLFVKGLMLFLITLIYQIPIFILVCLSTGTSFAMTEVDPDVAQALTIISGCLTCVQVVLSLLIAIIMPAAIIRYVKEGTFGAAFQFGAIFSFISANIGNYIIAILLSWVASMLAGLGLILCVVGVFFTMFWGMLVSGNLYGQLAREA